VKGPDLAAIPEPVETVARRAAVEEGFRAGQRRGLLLGIPVGFAAGGVAAFLVAFSLSIGRGPHPQARAVSTPATEASAATPLPAFEPSLAAVEAPSPAVSSPAADAVTAPAPSAADPRAAGTHPSSGERSGRGTPALSSAPPVPPAPKTRDDKNLMVNEL
jgi:hypothetical protein